MRNVSRCANSLDRLVISSACRLPARRHRAPKLLIGHQMDEMVIDQLVVYQIHLVGVSELKTEPKCVIDKSARHLFARLVVGIVSSATLGGCRRRRECWWLRTSPLA